MVYVIGIATVPGGGKTSLTKVLSQRLVDTAIVDYDSYQTFTKIPIQDIIKWLKNEANYDKLEIPKLGEDLARLKIGQSIIEPLQQVEIKPAQ